jgi:hypothetical protein
MDMANLGPVVALTNLFSEQELITKLAADPIIKGYLSDPPKNLDEIRNSLGEEGWQPPNGPCSFVLAPDYLTRFSLHHLIGKQVAVRIELSPVGGACRSATAELGLLLSNPPSLRSLFDAAASGRGGFLSKNKPPSPNNALSKIEFNTDTGKPNQ